MKAAGSGTTDMSLRPSRALVSRKIMALTFIRRFWAEHQRSPSYGEIGGGLGVSRKRAKELVDKLEADAAIIRAWGARRGIFLPDAIAQAEAMLRAAGRIAVEGGVNSGAPAIAAPFTNHGLPRVPELGDGGPV